jgi:catechol-2,3-dioxygenase
LKENAGRISKYILHIILITLEEKPSKGNDEEQLRFLILVAVGMKQRTSLAATTAQLTTVNEELMGNI